MFWTGVVYLVVLDYVMTPFTNNLDDIKITATHILGPIVMAVYLVLLARGWVAIPRAAISIPLGAYMGAMILSTLLAKRFLHWVGWETTMLQWVFLAPFLAFFAASTETRRLRHGLIFLTLLTLSSTIFGLAHIGKAPVLILKYVVPCFDRNSLIYAFTNGLAATFDSTKDMLSIILNRDFYGCFLVLMLPLVLGTILLSRSLAMQITASVTFILTMVCMNLANTKDGYVALAIAFVLQAVLYVYVARLPLGYRRRLLAIALGVASLMPTVIVLNLSNFLGQIKTLDVSFTSRAILWGCSIGMWTSSPLAFLIGTGPGSYRVLLAEFRRPDYFLFDISHRTLFSHNYFLDLLCETGVVGFVLFMAFLVALFRYSLRRVRRDPEPERRLIGVCLVAGMAGFLLNGITSPNARWPIGAVNFWAVLGMMAGYVQSSLPTGGADPARRARLFPATLSPSQAKIVWRVVLPLCVALGIYASYYGVRYYYAAVYNNRGIAILGDSNRPKQVYAYRTKMAELRAKIKDPTLSARERDDLAKELAFYEREFEKYRLMAIGWMRKSIEALPTYGTAYYKLATLLFMGPYDRSGQQAALDAKKVFLDLEAFWPEYAQLSFNLHQVYSILGDEENADKTIRRAAKQTIDHQIRKVYLSYLLKKGDYPAAIENAKELASAWERVTKKSLRKRPEEKETLVRTSLEYLMQIGEMAKDYDVAIDALKRLHRLLPENEMIVAKLTDAYLLTSDFAGLESSMEDLLDEFPADISLNFWLGYAALEQGKLRLAKRQALILRRIDPENIDADYLLYGAYRKTGQHEKAVSYAEAYRKTGTDPTRLDEVRDFLKEGSAAPSAQDAATSP